MEFSNSNKLKGYIKKESMEYNIHSNYAYNYYFTRYFLECLTQLDLNDQSFILAGSVSQFCNLKTLVRPITDIDIVCFREAKHFEEKIQKVINHDNSVQFEVKNKFTTPNETTNYRIMCKFDNIQHLIKIDFKRDVINDRIIPNNTMPNYFSKDKPFEIATVSLEEHMANKLYIILLNLYLYKLENKEFRRYKDFYDIYNILSRGSIDSDRTIELLNYKIQKDGLLSKFSFNDSIITSNFVSENQKHWDDDKNKLEFKDDVTFNDTVEVYRGIIKK